MRFGIVTLSDTGTWMVTLSQRDIVLLSFPFSDLQGSKVRPALILSNNSYNNKFEDFVAVPLTTRTRGREYSVLLTNSDLEKGEIIESAVKVDRIFSVSRRLVRMNIARINRQTHNKIKKILFELLE